MDKKAIMNSMWGAAKSNAPALKKAAVGAGKATYNYAKEHKEEVKQFYADHKDEVKQFAIDHKDDAK